VVMSSVPYLDSTKDFGCRYHLLLIGFRWLHVGYPPTILQMSQAVAAPGNQVFFSRDSYLLIGLISPLFMKTRVSIDGIAWYGVTGIAWCDR